MVNYNTPPHSYSATGGSVPVGVKQAHKLSEKPQKPMYNVNPGLPDSPQIFGHYYSQKFLSKKDIYAVFTQFVDDLFLLLRSTKDAPAIEKEKYRLGISSHGILNPRTLTDGDPFIPDDGLYLKRPFIHFNDLEFIAHDRRYHDLLIPVAEESTWCGHAKGTVSIAALDKYMVNHVERVNVIPLNRSPDKTAKISITLDSEGDHHLSIENTLSMLHDVALHYEMNQGSPLPMLHYKEDASFADRTESLFYWAVHDTEGLINSHKKSEEKKEQRLSFLAMRQGCRPLRGLTL